MLRRFITSHKNTFSVLHTQLLKYTTTTNPVQNQENTPTIKRGRLIFVSLIRSPAHQHWRVRKCLKALQLSKINQMRVHVDCPTIRGLCYVAREVLNVKSISTAELFPDGLPPRPPRQPKKSKSKK